jgi:hypothetical protein
MIIVQKAVYTYGNARKYPLMDTPGGGMENMERNIK